jgi:hypothetical protein
MPRQPKLGFAFIPQKANETQVDNYIKRVKEEYPASYILLSALSLNDCAADINKSFLDFVTVARRKEGIVKRFPPLLSKAWEEGVDRLFVNIRILTYPVETFLDYVKRNSEKYPAADLVIAEPRFMPKDAAFQEVIANMKVRRRLLVDNFINFTLTQARDGERGYMNVNAGMFSLRLTEDVMRALQTVRRDNNDSSLICPRIAWHIFNHYDNLVVRTLPVGEVNFYELGFSQEKALGEVDYIFRLVENRGVRSSTDKSLLMQTASDFFAKCEYVRSWKNDSDVTWFQNNIVDKLRR